MKLNKYDSFLLEKRIAQISSNIEVVYGFDIITTIHSDDRSDLSKRKMGYNHQMTNKEITNFIEIFKKEISEYIANGDIVNDTLFVIRGLNKKIAMVLKASEVTSKYWKLVIITIFPESQDHKLKTRYDQLVLEK